MIVEMEIRTKTLGKMLVLYGRLLGAQAENQARELKGESVAYPEEYFAGIIAEIEALNCEESDSEDETKGE